MRNTFTYLYVKAKGTGDDTALYDYFNIFKEELTNAQFEVYVGKMEGLAKEKGPWGEILSGVASVGGKVMAPAAWLETAYDAFTGQEVDTSSPSQLMARSGSELSEAAASTTASAFGKWMIQASVDLVASAPAFLMGPTGGALYLGLQTAGTVAERQNRSGASAWGSLVQSTVAGAITYFSSKIMLTGFGKVMTGTVSNLPATFGQKLMTYGMNALKTFGLGASTGAAGTLTGNIADMIIAGDRSQYTRLVNEYMDNGMTKEQAKTAAAVDLFLKQPVISGLKSGAIAAVMSIPGTAGAIRAGETQAVEQGAFKTARAMEAGSPAQAKAVKVNISEGLATLEQANARLAKQGGNANSTAFKTDAANNALMDYNTGKGSAEAAADAFSKVANEAIASGKLTAQEAADLNGTLSQTKVYVDAMALMGDNGGGIISNRVKLPIGEPQLKHIFRETEGHLPDTPANRTLLENVANNQRNYLGIDKYGNKWYAKMRPDGTQVWARVRNGIINNGGVNNIQLLFDIETGLNRNPFK